MLSCSSVLRALKHKSWHINELECQKNDIRQSNDINKNTHMTWLYNRFKDKHIYNQLTQDPSASQNVCMWPLGTKQPAHIYGPGINGAEKPHTVITNTSSKKKRKKTNRKHTERHTGAEN